MANNQQARFQAPVQMPPLPPTPELSGHFREGNGLFAPFAKYDQQHREWARQLGLNLQQAHHSVLRAAERKSGTTPPWPDRGWARLFLMDGKWWFDASLRYRPNSAAINIEVLANRTSGFQSSATLTAFNGQIVNGKWLTESLPIWVETGAVPRAFRVTILTEGTDTTRIGAVPIISLVPGLAVVSDGVKVMEAVSDGVVTVVSRVSSPDTNLPTNVYTCWLHSAMEDPTPDSELHCSACHVTLV